MASGGTVDSLYAVLEVAPNASPNEITEAYQRIMAYLEVDSIAMYAMLDEPSEAESQRSQVEEAYRVLGDPALRAAYDNARRHGGEDYPSILVPAAQSNRSSTHEQDDLPPSSRDVFQEVANIASSVAGEGTSQDDDKSTVVSSAPGHRESGLDEPPSPSGTPSPVAAQDVDAGIPAGDEVAQEQGSRTDLLMDDGAEALVAAPEPGPEPNPKEDGSGAPLGASSASPVPSIAPPEPPPSPPQLRTPNLLPVESSPRPRTAGRRLYPVAELPVISEDTEVGGGLFRSLRESAGATLVEVGAMTKISKRYLRAIEENDYEKLPAPVYVRGFVRQYAQVLGLDAELAAGGYMRLYSRYKNEAEG